jgi:hypothetical protein
MRRHELDPVSLTFGFAFTGLGLLFLIGRADQALRLHWVWPILLLVLGVGILADLARGRDSTDHEPAPPREGDAASEPEDDAASEREREDAAALEHADDEGLELGPGGPVDSRERPI